MDFEDQMYENGFDIIESNIKPITPPEDTSTSPKINVIIIGAGLSGLYAAKILRECGGLNVTVLEARDRVGGRTCTVENSDTYQYTDVGGAYIYPPTDKRMMSIIKELGLETYEVGDSDVNHRSVFHYGGSTRTQLISNPLEYLDIHRLHSTIKRMYQSVSGYKPWTATMAKDWDQMTFAQFLSSTCWTTLGLSVGARVTSDIFACEPHEVSLLAVLWVLSSRGGFKSLMGAYGPGERKVIGGAQKVSEALSSHTRVELSHPVVRLKQSDDDVQVTTSTGHTYNASYIICSIPQTLLNRISFEPPLPARKIQLIQRIPMGSVIKSIVFYKRSFWKESLNFSGLMVTDGGPISACLDDTKPDGSNPCIMGFITGSAARSVVHLTENERKELIIRQYARVFSCEEFLEPCEYVEKNWMGEEWSGGCYVAGFPPGVLTALGEELRRPIGRVHFAGTESAKECMGYMEGALESGERAAGEIIDRINHEK